jgi:hypothetical protein
MRVRPELRQSAGQGRRTDERVDVSFGFQNTLVEAMDSRRKLMITAVFRVATSAMTYLPAPQRASKLRIRVDDLDADVWRARLPVVSRMAWQPQDQHISSRTSGCTIAINTTSRVEQAVV